MLAGRSRELKADPKGRYRPYLGFVEVDGKRQPKRWNLGLDRSEAERRFHRLRMLYDDDQRSPSGPDGNLEGFWSPKALRFAELIASGATSIPLPIADVHEAHLVEYQHGLEQYRRQFPSLSIQPSNLEAFEKSEAQNQALVADRITELETQLKQMGAMRPASSFEAERRTGITVGKALEQFGDALKGNPKAKSKTGTTAWGKTRLDQHHSLPHYLKGFMSLDLGQLNKVQCDGMIEYIASRPENQRSGFLKPKSAKHLIYITRKFLEWLDGSELPWELPVKFRLDRRVTYRALDVSEVKNEIVTIPIEHLKTLVATATEKEKLYIGLALNCAYGADQLGRLQFEWIDWAASQIQGARMKRMTASRHYLWTCNLERMKHIDVKEGTMFLAPDGRPLYRTSDNGNAIDGFSRAWERLIKRVKQTNTTFPNYSFGKLRKTAATLTLRIADPHIASMLLAHKTISSDNLLEAYAGLPWNKLYEIQTQLEQDLVGTLGLAT